MRRRVTVVCLLVCLSVTTNLAYLVAKTLEFGHKWASNHTKLSQFCKELFGQELRCDLFVMLAC